MNARKVGRSSAAALIGGAALVGWATTAAVNAPMASASTAPSVLDAGHCMTIGSELVSPNRAYTLVMQSDGNLADYAGWGYPVGQRWLGFSANTNRAPYGDHACMQNDGNFVVYSADNKPLWWSGTNGSGGEHLDMQDDGNLVIYNNDYTRAVWSTGYSVQTVCPHPYGYSVAQFYPYPVIGKIAGITWLDAYVCSDNQGHTWFQNIAGRTDLESGIGPHCWVDNTPEVGKNWATGSCKAWIDSDGGITFGMAAEAQASLPGAPWANEYAQWTT